MYMTSHIVSEWQHNHCIQQHTYCICVITPTWLMISQPVYISNHTHCMYDMIGNLYDITSTLADSSPLIVCHDTYSVCDIICIIYDVTHTGCMTTQPLYLTWNLLKLLSHKRYMSSHPVYVWNHTHCMYASIGTLYDITYTIADNTSLFVCHGTHSVYEITCVIYDV